jgi:multicomponent Na+:H+ antiporter subunit D
MTLSLVTVFMGSMLAYREKILKKRLAYSTVSQASYILFGLSLLQPAAMTGALLHVAFHAVIKACLFLSAGAIIYKTHKTNAEELRGIGKEMPITIWCYTFASAALIGIPPASGFISKWYLATGSLSSGIELFSWLGPVVLLISALLTAGYLLPITVNGFLPGADFDYGSLKKCEPNLTMLIPLVILAVLAVVLGIFPNPLANFLADLADTVL